MKCYKEQITYYLNKVNSEINASPERLSEYYINQSLEALTHYIEMQCLVKFPVKKKYIQFEIGIKE
tara:strand:+ start:613 stop:810 length:198 start_codon:yes stop_codon:yes gene_type:complete